MPDKIRVFFADDHEIVLKGVGKALKDEPDMEMIGQAKDGKEALSKIKSLDPDILVLDIFMPKMNGLEAAREIRKRNNRVKIIIFSMMADKEYISELFKIGISGYIVKIEPISDLILAIRSVAQGGVFYSDLVNKVLKERITDLEVGEKKAKELAEAEDGIIKLSMREKEIFLLLAEGLRPGEIAERLGISPKTAETHKYNILFKLGMDNLAQLTKLAFKKHLIEV